MVRHLPHSHRRDQVVDVSVGECAMLDDAEVKTILKPKRSESVNSSQ